MFNIGTKRKTFTVEGMTCHHCEMTVERALSEIPNIKSARANYSNNFVEVEYKSEIDLNQVKEKIENAGYKFVSSN